MVFSAGLGFIFFGLMIRPLEIVFPAKIGQRFFRPGFLTDFCFFLGQNLIWFDLVIWGLSHFGYWLDTIAPLGLRQVFASQALWVQVIEVVLLSDFCIYWAHRLQHRVDFLWRFHAVHHSAEHLDWLAAYREHPMDSLYTMLVVNLPLYILGFPVSSLTYLIAFRGAWAVFIHSNVRIPIGPLRMVIGAPELHHWHHDRDRDAGNYANLSPLMDLLFGTYRCPDHEPDSFGLHEPFPRNYLGQLLQPFLPRRLMQLLPKRLFSSVFCGSLKPSRRRLPTSSSTEQPLEMSGQRKTTRAD